MKIKLRTMMSGPQGTFNPGSVLDIPACGVTENQANELIACKYAELISNTGENLASTSANNLAKSVKNIETATINAPENTSKINNKASGAFEIKHIGGGYYHVFDSQNKQVTEQAIKKSEAMKILKELTKG
ncbi:MAG: hypothetical protein PQ612_06015 [Rickettsiales bacterium]|nr:hypothetical protein [Pseudomonadota bacterium]MDA0966879.1 hypothetical protein [Pseudomonadota bacterium]MDG4543554.1 hypothetical protein [Rickettsiales bacterium]MDG4545702.1 hypothetical protein [Rickettsiales bacterium]MDG4547525.1 hypothetical protein [Rickettsiales bacterium]